MKQLKLAALALLSALAFAACSDDDDNPIIDPIETPVSSVYVINQGNKYSSIDGTIDRLGIDYGTTSTDTTYTSDVFNAVNGQSLGSTPENAIVYGSHLYVPMNGSNILWVLNAKTLKIEKQITTQAPMWVTAADGKVFVTNFLDNGTVTCIDTLSLSVTATIELGGPLPDFMCSANGKVYVSISDGYNSTNGCANGLRVSVIDPSTCTKEKDITVGMNPGQLVADAEGNVFVVCRGDYGATASKVQKIDATTDAVTDVCEGSIIAASDTVLYVVNSVTDYSDWPNTKTVITYSYYNTTTGAKLGGNFFDEANLPAYPTSISIEPKTGDFYVTSDQSASGYSLAGYLYIYNKSGQLRHRYDVGVHPCGVAFSY